MGGTPPERKFTRIAGYFQARGKDFPPTWPHPRGNTELGVRRRCVDEERDGDVLLLDEQLDEQLLESGVDVPVELAEVVAQGVVAVIGELDRLAALDAPAATLEAASDR